MDAKLFPKVIATILIVDGFVVGAVVGATVSPQMGLLVGLGAIVLPFVLVPPVLWLVFRLGGWTALTERYPAVERAAEAEGGKVTSLGLKSRLNRLNNCVEWWADDGHLHLTVIPPFGKLTKPVSIPWGEVVEIDAPRRYGFVRIELPEMNLWVDRKLVARELAVREAMEAEGIADPVN